MAFWKNRQSVIQALTSARLQVERAEREFGHQREEEDRQAMLWHTYKAQKCLKEAAALLVDTTNSGSSLRAFDRTRGNQQAENPDTVDCPTASRNDRLQFSNEILNRHCERSEASNDVEQSGTFDSHEASTSRDDALYGNEQSPQCEHAPERGAVDCPSKAERVPLSYREVSTTFRGRETTRHEFVPTFRINEMHKAFDKWLEDTKALIKICDNPEPLKGILATQIQLKYDLQGIMKSVDKIREENQ